MNRFINLSLIYGVGFLFIRGISFLLLPVYTNLLSTFDAGIMFIFYTILAFLNPLFAFGLDSALFKFYNSERSSNQVVVSSSLVFLFITSFFLSLMLLLISHTPETKNPLDPKFSLIQFKEHFSTKGVLRIVYEKVLNE